MKRNAGLQQKFHQVLFPVGMVQLRWHVVLQSSDRFFQELPSQVLRTFVKCRSKIVPKNFLYTIQPKESVVGSLRVRYDVTVCGCLGLGRYLLIASQERIAACGEIVMGSRDVLKDSELWTNHANKLLNRLS